jgi:hypothetical protein
MKIPTKFAAALPTGAQVIGASPAGDVRIVPGNRVTLFPKPRRVVVNGCLGGKNERRGMAAGVISTGDAPDIFVRVGTRACV